MKILLYHAGLGIVIKHSSGVIYSNQTMGHVCYQPELEGVFVPFDADAAWQRLCQYFEGPKYGGGGAMHGIDAVDADFIDGVILEAKLGGSFVVDRSNLKASHEAWVHVLIHSQDNALFEGFGPDPCPGVLTWQNSD